ncbi:cell envelope-related transcriptional attenuator, putative [Heliomicrobium modesticaldum Ice1]|uniref:Cell envelope-related transcriptional attenuator, putative n=1 Tax=Heliobacterium modesticaldum (strain ATCC 51547 / Ice1) TaxID=498761 RepID=B0TAW6_HELMI|nr:LCP family protein [Heliomicrobium modesticaldum]ABZ85077.1 cell envelope-related transcriptional attenuator, putative [Heliomicrobium modesticaldum Ice1]
MQKWQARPRLMIFFGLMLLLVVTAVVTYGILSPDLSLRDPFSPDGPLTESEINRRMNVLLLAVDNRPGESDGRTDTIIVASVDRHDKKLYLLSIPRDSRVKISGHGMDKINAAHMYGGVPLTRKTVEELLGIPIDYYVKTDFNGFREIVDTLGGVEIDVEKNMYHNEGDPEDLINLKKGLQRLSGKEALQYVRFRSDELGDISRTQRQQKFLHALAKQSLQVNTVWKLPSLVPQLVNHVETNLSAGDLVSLAIMAKDWNASNIIAHTLPGNFVTLNGVSYWQVDPAKSRQAALDFMRGVISTSIIDESIVVLEKPKKKSKTADGETKPETDQMQHPVSGSQPSDQIGADQAGKPAAFSGLKDGLEQKAGAESPSAPQSPVPLDTPDTPSKPPTSPSTPKNPQQPGPSVTPPAPSRLPDALNPTAPNRVVPGAPPVPTDVQPHSSSGIE